MSDIALKNTWICTCVLPVTDLMQHAPISKRSLGRHRRNEQLVLWKNKQSIVPMHSRTKNSTQKNWAQHHHKRTTKMPIGTEILQTAFGLRGRNSEFSSDERATHFCLKECPPRQEGWSDPGACTAETFWETERVEKFALKDHDCHQPPSFPSTSSVCKWLLNCPTISSFQVSSWYILSCIWTQNKCAFPKTQIQTSLCTDTSFFSRSTYFVMSVSRFTLMDNCDSCDGLFVSGWNTSGHSLFRFCGGGVVGNFPCGSRKKHKTPIAIAHTILRKGMVCCFVTGQNKTALLVLCWCEKARLLYTFTDLYNESSVKNHLPQSKTRHESAMNRGFHLTLPCGLARGGVGGGV